MLIDSDVLIWFYRGKERAKEVIFQCIPFKLSAISYMEIIQGVRNKEELRKLKGDMQRWATKTMQINDAISCRAITLMEKYALSHGLELGGALIPSTALEYNLLLITGNTKHYDYIPTIKISPFKVS